ncbi:MAG TPA: hypothetical protein VJB87_01345 [Candidatus Nanoarchaeia archaeon]|nr:hypothetical protein [Candidatus Nanoarchaeia archaeon]
MEFIPSKEEEQQLQQTVKDIIKKIRIPKAQAKLGGSGAKNTWLTGTHDIDIYIVYDYKTFQHQSEKLADITEQHLKKQFKLTRLHGSRDYFQTNYNNYTIEFIPILNIKKASAAKNITDISQLHVNYVNHHQKYSYDIRKAKAFCKAADVYGAESYIQGFSGYLVELLIIHYQGFNNFIKKVSTWKEVTTLGKKEDINNLNEAKKTSPLIVIDPTDNTRNAAAALNKEKYKQLIKACKNYLTTKNKEKYFITPTFNLETVKKSHNTVFTMKTPLGKTDIIGAALRKTEEKLRYALQQEDFIIKKHGWHWDQPHHNVYYYYNLKETTLPAIKERAGPPLTMTTAVQQFKKYHKKTFNKQGKIYSTEKRTIITPKDLISKLSLKGITLWNRTTSK